MFQIYFFFFTDIGTGQFFVVHIIANIPQQANLVMSKDCADHAVINIPNYKLKDKTDAALYRWSILSSQATKDFSLWDTISPLWRVHSLAVSILHSLMAVQ